MNSIKPRMSDEQLFTAIRWTWRRLLYDDVFRFFFVTAVVAVLTFWGI